MHNQEAHCCPRIGINIFLLEISKLHAMFTNTIFDIKAVHVGNGIRELIAVQDS